MMELTETEDGRAIFEDEDGRMLVVNSTHEGLILDAYQDDEIVGSMAMMADEWFDHLLERNEE